MITNQSNKDFSVKISVDLWLDFSHSLPRRQILEQFAHSLL